MCFVQLKGAWQNVRIWWDVIRIHYLNYSLDFFVAWIIKVLKILVEILVHVYMIESCSLGRFAGCIFDACISSSQGANFQTRWHRSNPLVSSFLPTQDSVSRPWLTEMELGAPFFCCSTSTAMFCMLWVQRCSPSYHWRNVWLDYIIILLYCQLELVQPFSSNLSD